MKLPDTIKHFLMKIPGSQLGFTMIELLVVISVIGILAVAVLSSINPIEQINKGRDTRTRSDAAQLINAVDRYYAIHEIYPWNDATYVDALTTGDTLPSSAFPDGGPVCTAGGLGSAFCDVTESTGAADWLSALDETEEVKDSYTNRLRQSTSNPLFVYKEGNDANATMYVCFTPTSKAFEDEAVKGCQTKSDLPTEACPQGTPGDTYPDPVADYGDEYICLP